MFDNHVRSICSDVEILSYVGEVEGDIEPMFLRGEYEVSTQQLDYHCPKRIARLPDL